MRNVSLACAAALLLAACSAAQVSTAESNVQSAALVIDAGACAAQAAANDATAALTAAGDANGAAQSAKVSAVAGSACMTLAQPLPVAPVAPAAAPAS
jgi:hypothetical protein